MRVEMLAVGKELLIGRTMNSNGYWIGKRLARMGTMLKEITTVDDELDEIASAYKAAVRRNPDFLIVVGGLGPTPDDMTLEGIANGVGVSLRRNDQALALSYHALQLMHPFRCRVDLSCFYQAQDSHAQDAGSLLIAIAG